MTGSLFPARMMQTVPGQSMWHIIDGERTRCGYTLVPSDLIAEADEQPPYTCPNCLNGPRLTVKPKPDGGRVHG